ARQRLSSATAEDRNCGAGGGLPGAGEQRPSSATAEDRNHVGRSAAFMTCIQRVCLDRPVFGIGRSRPEEGCGAATVSAIRFREAALWGHSATGADVRHRLVDHLRGTARLSRRFGEAFGAAELCAALGLLHDAGKAAAEWQRRLLAVEGSDSAVDVPHKQLGTRLLTPRAGPASVCVLGHHGGLEEYGQWRKEATAPRSQAEERTLESLVAEVPEVAAVLAEPEPLLPDAWRGPDSQLVLEVGTRLAVSALVGAGHPDTAAHFECLDSPRLRGPADMAALVTRFEAARAALLAGREPSPVDGVRAEVYDAAVAAAAGPPGIYRLPAPTGAGKT